MHMKARSWFNSRTKLTLVAVAILFICLGVIRSASAQSITIDFQFDPSDTGFNAGAPNVISPLANADYKVNVFATVFGDASHTNINNYGLNAVLLRGFSQAIGGGASAPAFTGGTMGVTSTAPFFAATSPFNSGQVTAPSIGDVGSTTNGTSAVATLDSIADFGARANNATDLNLQTGNNSVMASAGGFIGTGANVGGWTFEIAQFVFHTGAIIGAASSETDFWPTRVAGITAAASITQDGVSSNTLNVASTSETVGSPLRFLVVTPNGSANWNLNGNGNYNDVPNWDPRQIPGSAALVATFGNGTTNTVNVPNVTVTVNAAERVGTLNFNNTNGTSFTLGNDGVAGHSLTLDNNGAGATINSLTGNNWIFPNLVLADSATFNVAAGSSVLVSLGNISESGASRGITKTGAGTLTIDTTSAYTGTTSVTAGTLVTTPTGTISTGPLVVSAANAVSSVVSLNNDQTVSSLSGTVAGSGVAAVSVAGGTTLTVAQATDTTFDGKISLAGGGTFVKSSNGRLETKGAPTLGNGSVINVTAGTLRFNATSGAAIVGTGVAATVSGAAVLELAGSVSALSSSDSPTHRVNITNNSTAAAGLLVTGTNQQVGKIDGPGNTSVATGGSLTANHIVQSALVIGGTAGTPAIVTIAASNAAGNSLAESSGFALASLPLSSDSLGAGTLGSSSLLAAGGEPSLASAAVGNLALGAGSEAVPEPSTLALILLGCAFTACLRKCRPATRLR
jgi:autotransporter-associated beta strand protein